MASRRVREIVVPEVTVTVGSKFAVCKNFRNGRWALYHNTMKIAEYEVRSDADEVKREMWRRRQRAIDEYMAHPAAQDSAQGGGR